jgi:hypothetical protein
MDKRIFATIARVMFGLALACLTSGCFTQRLTEHSNVFTHTYFIPSAVYEATNSPRMGLEGKLLKEASNRNVGTELGHGYLILPESVAVAPDAPNWLDSVGRKSPNGIKAVVTNSLPAYFVKVRDLHNNYRGVFIADTERHPNKGWLALAPVTVTLDIATFPFQALFLAYALCAFKLRC